MKHTIYILTLHIKELEEGSSTLVKQWNKDQNGNKWNRTRKTIEKINSDKDYKKITDQYLWWTYMQKYSIQYSNWIQQYIKELYTMIKWDLFWGSKDGSICKSINMINYINKMKDRNLKIILIDAEKPLDKIQNPFTIKNSQNWVMKEHTQTQQRLIMRNPHPTSHPSKKLKAFPLRSGTRQGSPLLQLVFNIVLKVLAREVRQ